MTHIPFRKNAAILAPMAGITDSGFRRICRKYGADATVTEMISSKGVFYNDEKSKKLMDYTVQETPIVIQIFGSDCECMKAATEYIQRRCSPAAIDINMGCPAPKIFQNGDGCALMRRPEKAAGIISAVKENSSLPVSVKFRSGIDGDQINAVEFALMCQAAGADFITVHGRTRAQFYSGRSDASVIKAVVDSVAIPVIANGDVTDGATAKELLSFTGAYGLMIGRGALGNPLVFRNVQTALHPDEVTDAPDLFTVAKEHLTYVVQDKGEAVAVREFRKHLLYYLKGVKNAATLKRMSTTVVTLKDCENILTLAAAD